MSEEKTILVCGAGGFIGNHMVNRLIEDGHGVVGVDINLPEYNETKAEDFFQWDLRDPENVANIFAEYEFDEVYQFAADMGGAGYIFTGEHDADVMHNSALVNLNVVRECVKNDVDRVFYSSSACIYPEHNQLDPNNPNCVESSAYPANPDSEYGWEKLFSERLYESFSRNYGLTTRICRYHNIFGPMGTWNGGREKAPAAMCRKVAEAEEGGQIEVWGPGDQTRSFLYIDDCLQASIDLMATEDDYYYGPTNIGSEEMVSINQLAQMAIDISGKDLTVWNNLENTALGVRGRVSENSQLQSSVGWKPTRPLKVGMINTYEWIEDQVAKGKGEEE